MSDTGYHHCSCRDCFELYVGEPGEMCSECESSGCDNGDNIGGECQCENAYCMED